jgi:hypothetical protein
MAMPTVRTPQSGSRKHETSIEHRAPQLYWSTGRVVPRLLATIAILMAGSGLLPLSWFGFSDFQIARQMPPPDSPFVPNLRIASDRYSGGYALAGNLPSSENRRRRTFTTDALGFRWTPEVRPGEPPGIIVFRGFSFVWGGSLSDEETLPAELARQLQVNAYNGARFLDDVEQPPDFDRLTAKLAVRPKLAIYVHLEQDAHVLAWHEDSTLDRLGKRIAERPYRMLSEFAGETKRSALNWVRLSPMIQLSTRARKALQNDAILPNVYRKKIAAYETPDGGRMLFENAELERAAAVVDDATIRDRAAFIASWHGHMLRRGMNSLVLLIPDKVSVYGPELGIGTQNPLFLDRLERELGRRGVPAINGLTVLRPTAAADLASGQLSYWRDDGHWTPLGVQRIARATAQALRDDSFAPVTEAVSLR